MLRRLLRQGAVLRLPRLKQQSLRRQEPRILQKLLQLLPLDAAVLQRYQPLGRRKGLSLRQHPAQPSGLLHLRCLRLSGHLPLHAAGADGGQQSRRRLGAEQEGGVGRSLLHDLQQHVLIPLVQLTAVGKDIHLPGAVVGADIHILPQLAHQLHRQLLVSVVPHRHHVGVDVLQHLAALAAPQAGTLPLSLALQCGGEVAGGGHAISAAGENGGVAQRPLGGRRTDAPGQCAVFRDQLFHAVSALPCHTGWSYAPNIIS